MLLASPHRVTAAVLLALILALSIFGTGLCAIDVFSPHSPEFFRDFAQCLLHTVPFVVVVSILVFPIVVVVGVPAFIYCSQRGWLSWWHMVLVGFVCSLPASLLLTAITLEWSKLLEIFYFCVSIGLIGGLLFWLIGVYRNSL